ncbi:MAG: malonic semialdehyde reductase [Zoogloeaceae bacterium]|jgi:3-hydroxypropanoate dehydrogenase|nr:malonic semialdehyde reductase [Zoogloeaceae bacterium]
MASLASESIAQLFTNARTFSDFRPEAVPEAVLRQLFDIWKWAPTGMNAQPARLVFVREKAGKEKLKPCLMAGNVKKTLAAPVTVIVAEDKQFYDHITAQFPAYDAKPMFAGNPAMAAHTASQNTDMQSAYLILAARALGLDCGPMTGFDAAAVNAAFFPDGRYNARLLCNLGYGVAETLYPRGPRLPFETVCTFA